MSLRQHNPDDSSEKLQDTATQEVIYYYITSWLYSSAMSIQPMCTRWCAVATLGVGDVGDCPTVSRLFVEASQKSKSALKGGDSSSKNITCILLLSFKFSIQIRSAAFVYTCPSLNDLMHKNNACCNFWGSFRVKWIFHSKFWSTLPSVSSGSAVIQMSESNKNLKSETIYMYMWFRK